MKYGTLRRHGRKADPAVRHIFRQFAEDVSARFTPSAGGRFEVSVMTYDDAKRRLFFFEGSLDGHDLPSKSWNFSLPFGLGLAGACFKEADRAFLYERPEAQGNEPGLDLPIPDGVQHEFLLALPIYNPGLGKVAAKELEESLIERSRFCIAVGNIGSTGKLSKSRLTAPQNFPKNLPLLSRSQEFG